MTDGYTFKQFGDFLPMPKTSHLISPVIVTEKIDGTNGCIEVADFGNGPEAISACSRERRLMSSFEDSPLIWHKLDAKGRPVDNYGFGAWVAEHGEQLAKALGAGRHFGEWWGQGIQRGYGQTSKRFSLFNVKHEAALSGAVKGVPVLYEGDLYDGMIDDCLRGLRERGSVAAPGFKNFEGIVVHFAHNRTSFKVVLDAQGRITTPGMKARAAEGIRCTP